MSSKFCIAALNNELDRVRSASQGERGNVLFRSGAALYGLVAGGELEEGMVWESLAEAGKSVGLGKNEIASTINSAKRAGFKNPRRAPTKPLTQPITFTSKSTRRIEENSDTCKRPPHAEVQALWDASRRVGETSAIPSKNYHNASMFLLGRRKASGAWEYGPRELRLLHELDLCRVLPEPDAYKYPSWWPSCWANTWVLAVRAHEPDGTLASLHARAVIGSDELKKNELPKTRWPLRCEAKQLLFADHNGLNILCNNASPSIESVFIVEGLTDFLAAVLFSVRNNRRLAVFGFTSGGEAAFGKIRYPEGKIVYVASDNDKTGDRYAIAIRSAIPRHVQVNRVFLGGKG